MKKEFIEIEVENLELRKVLGIDSTGLVKVESKNGIPLNREWRNRLKDAAIDNCVSLCNNKPKSSTVVKNVAKKGSNNASS